MSEKRGRGMFKREILEPKDCQKLSSAAHGPVWVYRYTAEEKPWVLCIATQAEPNSGKLSLGGFRIVPAERASIAGFDPAVEAIGLACGMSEKVYWSKAATVGGPLGIQNLPRITGGKCVLLPSKGYRVGEPGDKELLDFAIECLKDMESVSGVNVVTGQDLGHGLMSSGECSSLKYMVDRFRGSTLADTGKPTGSGNFYILKGMLRGLGIDLKSASLGFIGAGNVGRLIVERSLAAGAKAFVVENNPQTRKELAEMGAVVFEPKDKAKLLSEAIDAVVLNANGGSLDLESIAIINSNPRLKIVCGSENLVCPDPSGPSLLAKAGKVFAPTELCGMMGYLTAVEDYLSRQSKKELNLDVLFEASKKLEVVGERITKGEFSTEVPAVL